MDVPGRGDRTQTVRRAILSTSLNHRGYFLKSRKTYLFYRKFVVAFNHQRVNRMNL